MRRILFNLFISINIFPVGTDVQYEDLTTAKYEDLTDVTHE